MATWHGLIRRALATGGKPPDDDVVEELAQHAQAMYDAASADGASHDEADGVVRRQIEQWRSDAKGMRRPGRQAPVPAPPPAPESARWLSGLSQDVWYALRVLRRQPRFVVLVVFTMAIGIGATTVLFGVTYGVLVKPLPWSAAERLVVLGEKRGGHAPRFGAFTNAAYLAWREQPVNVEELAAWSPRTVTLAGDGNPERIRVTAGTASLFRVLGVQPMIGSLFGDAEEKTPVVVLSEGLWRQRFGGAPSAVGRILRLDGEPHTIVGVVPDAMSYPDRQSRAWIPMSVRPATNNWLSLFQAIARLRPDASAAQAAAEGTARGRFAPDTGMTTMAIFGGTGPVEVSATPLREAMTADVRRPLVVLLAAVGLLLVIATANVASLQLARATARRRELAIRAALGAGAAGAIRPLIVESLLLGMAGGAAGLGVAWLLHRGALAVLPADFPRVQDLGLDATIVLFTIVTSAMTSLACAALPALRFRRGVLAGALTEDRLPVAGLGGRTSVTRGRLAIVASQVAIASVLLAGAALLGRSFVEQLRADRGFDPSRVLSAPIPMPDGVYSPERRAAILEQVLSRLAPVPGVQHAAFTSEAPLTPGGSTSSMTIRSRTGVAGTAPVQAAPRLVSPGYFAALGLHVISGRALEETDTAASQRVAVVNETFARRYLGDSAIGATIPMGVWGNDAAGEATIVGVVEDIRYVGANVTSLPEMYFSYRQVSAGIQSPVVTLLVRADDPARLTPALRSAVRAADGTLVPASVMTLEDRLLATSLARPRLYAVLLLGFAIVALLVTGVGLFAVLSYMMTQRTRELGVRAALGARRIDLVALVVRDGLTVVLAGVAAGLLLAAWLSRFISTLLYGVTRADSVTYVAVPLVILAVAALACLAPALRAARLDPMEALRTQ